MYEVEGNKTAKESIIITGIKKVFRTFYDMIEMFVISCAVVVFLYLFIASPHEVDGRSMEDNFWNGEYLLADKISYNFKDPKVGDVVIFKQPETADYIKRVIAVEGDSIEVRDGYYYLNGEKLDESEYLDDDVYTSGDKSLNEGRPYTVKEGEVFVSGDNREHSRDSREFGAIEVEQIKARAVLIYWPITHLSIVSRPEYNGN